MTKTPERSGDLAEGETSDGERTPPTSVEGVANALDRWDEEGGAPAASWPLPYETGDLLDAERRVPECLGAALVSEWNDLPTDVQRRHRHAATDLRSFWLPGSQRDGEDQLRWIPVPARDH